MNSCRIVESGTALVVQIQKSYDPSAKRRRTKSCASKHICVISRRIVEFGLASANKGQNFHEPSVVACRINLEFEKQIIYV